MHPPLTLPAAELCRLVRDAREYTHKVVAGLRDEQFTVPLMQTVNPFGWELGHVAFFYDVFLLPAMGEQKLLLPGAEKLYDSFKVDHDDRWGLPLPSRQETLGYLARVLERAVERIDSSVVGPKVTYLTLLSVIHEDMHAEAFTYMRQTLAYAAPPLGAALRDAGAGSLPGDVEIPGGKFLLGATAGPHFVFDNEKWAHPVNIAPFRMARAPVTNAEYADFVDDGGYRRADLWSHLGWSWRTKVGARHPVYWARYNGGWLRRHYDRFVPLEPHHPVVHASWYEAEAYCAWAQRRLPTEAEWEMAASIESGGRKRRYPWSDDPPSPDLANIDGHRLGCVDVGAFPEGDSAFGCRQMIGNVWEWTASEFYPFPGYVVDEPYREYSAPWFGYRKVLKGGSWATRSRFAWNTLRNFFQPDRRDVFAGFRTCAR